MIELPKLDEQAVPIDGGLINWLLFLKGADKSKWEVLTMREPTLKKAMTTLEFLSQDEEARRLYEARQKYLHDEASMLEGARTEGVAKGKLEMAKKLFSKGIDIKLIAETSGMSEEEIRNMLQ